MAYLHRKTYDILGMDRCGAVRMEDCFQVDDLLAETVQLLNTRGYITVSSSAGAPYGQAETVLLRNVRDSSGRAIRADDLAEAYAQRFPQDTLLGVEKVDFSTWRVTRLRNTAVTSITFRDELAFKKLPKHTSCKGRTIFRDYGKLSGMALLQAIYEYNNTLLEWAGKLPLRITRG